MKIDEPYNNSISTDNEMEGPFDKCQEQKFDKGENNSIDLEIETRGVSDANRPEDIDLNALRDYQDDESVQENDEKLLPENLIVSAQNLINLGGGRLTGITLGLRETLSL